MKTRASILRQAPGTFETAELELRPPRPDEITVKLAASGLCHSDDHLATGDMPAPRYPIAGGHEGSGVVQEVGSAARGFAEGDHVVFSFIPGCGRCRFCARGQQNLCDLGVNALGDPSKPRLSLDGAPVAQMAGISTFSEYTTVHVNSAVKIPDDIPLHVACLTGCGVGTGWGSAVNSADIYPGDTVIVMGIGGIGINAVQGARHAGAATIIAVDPVAFKREKAQELGATHAVDSMEEATEVAKGFTNGQGADAAIVTVGVVHGEHIGQAFAAIRKGGTAVVTGVAPATEVGIPVSPFELTLMQKRLQGSLFGACSPSIDILRQLELYRSGLLKLDELVTSTYTLDEVAKGYADMHAGKNIRGVVLFD
jgi:NDMA-dependent alcohol dehydrogenase